MGDDDVSLLSFIQSNETFIKLLRINLSSKRLVRFTPRVPEDSSHSFSIFDRCSSNNINMVTEATSIDTTGDKSKEMLLYLHLK